MDDDSREFEGVWWLPVNPKLRWDGDLSWQPTKSPRLRIKYLSASNEPPPDEAEAFQGYDAGGTPITVLRAGSSGGTRSGFLSTKKYSAGHILRGIHVESLKDFHANRVDFWLQYLGPWMSEEGFKEHPEAGNNKWQIEYHRPADREFQLSSATTLKICHSSYRSTASRRRSIRYDIFFSVVKQRPFPFSRAFYWLDALRNLLHFASLRRVRTTAIQFEDFEHMLDVGEVQYPRELELFTAGIHRSLEKDPLFFDFVFRFTDVENRFSELCRDWFRFCTEYREALRSYTTTAYCELPCEIRLICLTQALEAFHQRRFKPKSGSSETQFLNRVSALCNRHGNRLSSVVGDLERFAVSVRDSRHYYTHHDPEIRRRGIVASGTTLTFMTYHLQFLFRLCVLSEFGLEADPHSVLLRQIPGRITEYFL